MRNLKKEQFGGLRPLAVFSIDIALVGVIKISSLPYEWIIRRTSYEISTTLLHEDVIIYKEQHVLKWSF